MHAERIIKSINEPKGAEQQENVAVNGDKWDRSSLESKAEKRRKAYSQLVNVYYAKHCI